MNKRTLAGLSFALLLCSLDRVGGAEPRRSPADAPWLTLFNGKDLAGWQHIGGGRASVQDGCLVLEHDAERRPGYLLSEVKARDFDARVICKVVTGDSGFFYRSRRHAIHATEVCGPQVQLNVEPGRGLGGIFELHGRAWVKKTEAALNAELIRDLDWIDCELSVRGPQINVRVNGRTTVDFKDESSENAFQDTGHFALQIHGGGHCRVLFKEIRVRIHE